MDDKAKNAAEALFKAIKAEGDGYHFYQMAAQSCGDQRGREVFELLAAEELDHKQFLTAQYRAVSKSGEVDAAARLGPRADLSGASPIFSEAIKGRLNDAHYEMSALSIGIQLEQNSMRYYEECAAATSNPDLKRFFEELARWEQGHYDALLRQQETLRDDYWSGSGFAPF